MTTTIRSSADGSKSYIAVGGTDRVTIGSQGIEAGSYKPGSIVDTALALSANSAPVKAALNAGGDAPIYACRAWVNFNGTGTVAIRASGNVSSITDNGMGDYTVNFTTAMSDANYAALVTAGGAGVLAVGNTLVGWAAGYGTSSLRIGVSDNNTDANTDATNIHVAIFR